MVKIFGFTLKSVLWILFILVEFVIIYFNSAVWLRLDPPASALLSMPKLYTRI